MYGIRKPDETWLKYKGIIDSLEAAGLSWEDAPDEVLDFFDHEPPDPQGITVELGSEYQGSKHECCEQWAAEMENGFVIDISKLPKNITHIRFVNSF